MKRNLRTEILCQCTHGELLVLKTVIEDTYQVKEIEPPHQGLVMVKMRDSAQLEKFYLGEVLITECKVMLESVIGVGIVMGRADLRCKIMAMVDAVYNLKSEMSVTLDQKLMVIHERIKKKKALEINKLLETKVNFETLYEEVKS